MESPPLAASRKDYALGRRLSHGLSKTGWIPIAILATDGFEQSELFDPKDALEKAGAHAEVISPKDGAIKGWKNGNWGRSIAVDLTLDEADPNDYDALVLPGGVINPDKLRINEKAVRFVDAFVKSGRPIAAICHGPQTLLETNCLRGRTVTSWPSLRTDLENAGATWVDEAVVNDHGLVTSRMPEDLPFFNEKMIEEFGEGRHLRHAPGSRPRQSA